MYVWKYVLELNAETFKNCGYTFPKKQNLQKRRYWRKSQLSCFLLQLWNEENKLEFAGCSILFFLSTVTRHKWCYGFNIQKVVNTGLKGKIIPLERSRTCSNREELRSQHSRFQAFWWEEEYNGRYKMKLRCGEIYKEKNGFWLEIFKGGGDMEETVGWWNWEKYFDQKFDCGVE